VSGVKRINGMTNGSGRMVQTPSGTTFMDDFEPEVIDWRVGQIVHDATMLDERYKVKFAYIATGSKTTDQITFSPHKSAHYETGQDLGAAYPITATNTVELLSHSHLLQDDTIVQLYALYDRQNPPRLHWFFTEPLDDCSTDSPTSLPGGTTSANSTTWDVGADGALTLTVVSSVYWTGTVLYKYTRTLTFDACGNLHNVSGETQTVIDTPTPC